MHRARRSREFRGAWVASVLQSRLAVERRAFGGGAEGATACDPRSRRGAEAQRHPPAGASACDALYASKLEPWSTIPHAARQGGDPGYDPLAFAIEEAHARGLELHAWFNPFRARSTLRKELSANHVTSTHPEWVRRYGSQLWLDPGRTRGARVLARRHARCRPPLRHRWRPHRRLLLSLSAQARRRCSPTTRRGSDTAQRAA